jgi:hypothetical protein
LATSAPHASAFARGEFVNDFLQHFLASRGQHDRCAELAAIRAVQRPIPLEAPVMTMTCSARGLSRWAMRRSFEVEKIQRARFTALSEPNSDRMRRFKRSLARHVTRAEVQRLEPREWDCRAAARCIGHRWNVAFLLGVAHRTADQFLTLLSNVAKLHVRFAGRPFRSFVRDRASLGRSSASRALSRAASVA